MESGFFVDGDAKAFAQLTLNDGKQVYLITQNRDSLKVFTKPNTQANQQGEIIRIKPLETHAVIERKDGKKRKVEFYFGSGYLSSSSRTIVKDENVVAINVFSQNDNQE
jgi:hypothetical protein